MSTPAYAGPPTTATPLDDAPGRVLHSDPHDFAGLYIRHRTSFTLHARRYLRDTRDAEEVVQEAFLRLFLALPELETELQALAYCRRTITNLCIDRYRAQSRRPSLVALDSVSIEDLPDDDHGDPVIRAEDAATVREALSLLSPLHRAALVKREIEEKPLPQIADELEIPEESVKHVLFRARRALRRILVTTSLAPGADGEAAGTFGRVLSKGQGGVAALVLLLALGLSTGPDLRSIPVAGAVLPDLPSISDVLRAVGEAVTGRGGEQAAVSAGGGGGTGNLGGPQAFDGPGPLAVIPGASPSPGAAAGDPMDATSASPTVGLLPQPVRAPSPEPSPPAAAASSPLSSPTDLPNSRPPGKPVVVDPPRSQPVPDLKPAAPSNVNPDKGKSEPSKSDTGKPVKTGPVTAPSPGGSTSAPNDKPSPPATAPVDPEAWDTAGLVWQNDPKTQQPVLVPAGSLPGFDS